MSEPFSHPGFRKYEFEELPLNRDVFLMDERWVREYEAARIERFNRRSDRNVGVISLATQPSVAPQETQPSCLGIPMSLIGSMRSPSAYRDLRS
jgi:hypothetical protein